MNTDIESLDKIEITAATDVGLVRKENEDFFYFSNEHKFIILCDGMGGHSHGATASRIAGETLRDVLLHEKFVNIRNICDDLDGDLPLPAVRLIAGIRLANRRIIRTAARFSEMRGMGSTVVAALFHEDWVFSAHVGDSRIYRLRQGELDQLSRDHSWISELLEDKDISEGEIANFKKRNVLTRALGAASTVKIDIRIENFYKNDRFLLCSDGLYNALDDEHILSVLSGNDTSQEKTSRLIQDAKVMDGSDNITGAFVDVLCETKQTFSPTVLEKTIDNESSRISSALERQLKYAYPLPRRVRKKHVAWMAASVSALAVIFFMIFQLKVDVSPETSVMSSGLMAQNIQQVDRQVEKRAPTGKMKDVGDIVILQVQNDKYLSHLKKLAGTRIIDVVGRRDGTRILTPGRYRWTLRDSANRILFEKRPFQLTDQWRVETPRTQKHTEQVDTTRQYTPAGYGAFFIIGEFDSVRYADAMVYANRTKLGSLATCQTDGMFLKFGNYNITVRDSRKRILLKKQNVYIGGNEIVAIEF